MIEPRPPKESLTSARRGPGERIKAARIKAGQDIEWVAAQLRLRKSVIEALERNDYDNLPPPVFIKGYLRTYSDILGLPQQEILKEYHDSVAPRGPELASAKADGVADAGKGREQDQAPIEIEPKTKSKSSPGTTSAPAPAAGSDLAPAQVAPKPKVESPAVPAQTPAGAKAERAGSGPASADGPPQKSPASKKDVASTSSPSTSGMGKRPDSVLDTIEKPPLAQSEGPISLKPFGLRSGGKEGRAQTRMEAQTGQGRGRSRLAWPRLPSRARLLRWGLSLLAVLLIGLLLYWGIGQLGKIRIRSPEAVMQNLKSQWSRLFGEPTTPAIPAPQGYQAPSAPAPLSLPPARPLSEDAQLLEPSGLTASLYEPEPVEEMTAAEAVVDEAGPPQVRLEMQGSSWVEVEDASGEYRLVGELKKGEVHDFGGVPPYRVLFGRSNMVQLYVDGQPYDFSRLQQGAVARFSLNP
ncbi:MAG: DUF4115 domain-containing protein [Gammaproteobacteria bacterium SHHR-1]|uniref:helix-turn-helix domain-containing protein n=1 Tax=Magnetovirga frankeli TaxID=947516 RepID=UPI001293C603|nr:DUF4115 domain-containing protein [gamma proteobacterium SS-5]